MTFDSQGGSPVAPVDADYNTALGANMPADPTKTGYTFAGWNTGGQRIGHDV